jgi:poly-gamma-glutamate synthesis protein (capsule biosynthesis protein)
MLSGVATLGLLADQNKAGEVVKTFGRENTEPSGSSDLITLFLCGDVMTGRGIDQVLPHPSDPRLCEPYLTSAVAYVKLAERANGPIPKPVDFSYVWGAALEELRRVRPDARIINLETSITKHQACEPKGINYRMNPENIPCLTAAKIDCCVLANNHVLDWGYPGLLETLDVLENERLNTAGAGRNSRQAAAPAVIEVAGKGRVVVFSFGSMTSGIPRKWAAAGDRPGVNLLEGLSIGTVDRIAKTVQAVKRPRDIVVASIHWGGNWGYQIPPEQTEFAHRLIDDAGIDIVHGHSSHHAKGIEVYNGKPILYGCGDFLDDYEGISGYEAFRDDLALMYFVSIDASTGKLVRCEMTPLQIRNFRLNRPSREDAKWLRDTLNREGRRIGTRVDLTEDTVLILTWR